MIEDDEIIETKLRVPHLRHRLLSRQSLLEGLAGPEGGGCLVTAIAPAGSGKSTLLIELHRLLGEHDVCCSWLSLDADDNEPVVFAKYLITALLPYDRAAAEKELAFIKSNPTRDLDRFFDGLVIRLTRSENPLALLLDDFQHIDHPAILRFFNRLIAHAPPALRLGVASRNRLPLDLGRKRISGSLREIGAAELNFSAEESRQFMAELHAINLTPADLATLHQTTEGWAAGLQLAALALSRAGSRSHELIQSFSGAHKDLTEYLFQTVLGVQSEDLQHFLLQTSALTRLSPGLCNAVCGDSRGAALLDRVERSNLFLIPLDHEGRWYRYHHLFADFLQAELRRRQPEEFKRVCEVAASWSERQGRLTEAVQYCLSGERYERAADLIAEKAPDIAQYQGDHFTILDWMRRLPDEYHRQRPEIMLNHAWSRAFSRDIDHALDLSDAVLHTLEGETEVHWQLTEGQRANFRWLARTIKAIANICADRLLDTLEQCQSIHAELPATEPFLIASILNATSYGHLASGNLKRSLDAAEQAYVSGKQAGSVYATVWADFLSCLAHVESAQIQQAKQRADRAIRDAGPRTRANRYMFAMAAIAKAETHTQQGAFEAASDCLQASQEFSSLFGPREPLWAVLRNEARAHAWLGSAQTALECLRQGQDTALATDQPLLYYSLVAEEIDLLLRHGQQTDTARDLLNRCGLLDPKQRQALPQDILPMVQELAKLSEVRLMIADGQAEDALRQLSLLGRSCEHRRLASLKLRGLRCVALWQAGRQNEAEREMDRLLGSCAPEQLAYPILASGGPALDILESIIGQRTRGFVGSEQQIKHRFEQQLITRLRGGEPESTACEADSSLELTEPLTDREVEILRLVSAGLANQQLADELLISVATVKWHLHNIYEKFGVRSRSAAAALARQNRLI